MSNPFIAARIPETIDKAISKKSKETGESRTKILTNALKAYLGGEIELPKSIEKRVSELEKIVSQLGETPKKPIQETLFDNKPDNKLVIKEKTIDNKSDNKFDNRIKEEWTTKELEAIGINRKTIEYRLKANKLPYVKGNVIVYGWLRKENRNGRITSVWDASKTT